MVTYPSTHGVFEERIGEIGAVVTKYGGQVYLDGANLNVLVGTAKPGEFGADVSTPNLHKTFCIPHGGGGPGCGPVAVKAHLRAVRPDPSAVPAIAGGTVRVGVVILPISWMYVARRRWAAVDSPTRPTTRSSMRTTSQRGRPALSRAVHRGQGRRPPEVHSRCAADNPIDGSDGRGHRQRLVDYGFHAPTMAFPVVGTLMIEPDRSEALASSIASATR